MGDKIIQVTNLVKNYGDFAAVKGISFEVYEGEIFGLLGPNGAGKSTTLEIIETLRQKTSGEVIVDGFNLDNNPADIKKIIGVQLQSSGYYPGLNLVELIELFCGLYNQVMKPMIGTPMKNINVPQARIFCNEEVQRKLLIGHQAIPPNKIAINAANKARVMQPATKMKKALIITAMA